MPEQTTHPSPTDLHAYGLGQLPPDEATAIEKHIGECEPCCETIADLSFADTFIELLQNSEQEPDAQTVDHQTGTANPNSAGVPEPLAQHPRYEIINLIGKGGMGDVYQARHRKMERTVALKVINRGLVRKAEAVDRFHREVKAAAQLSHPNIVTSHDADHAGDFHFMVMEFVDGVDLSKVVKDRGALPVADACDYVRQAAVGLQHAHERGMVHRDIKPHNMMVTADGTIKILDFGLASLAPEAIPASDTVAVRSDLTAAGALMGTPDFISPEQANDARSVDIRSDIYSLGATFYFLLSGRPLFADGSVMEKLKGHAQFEPEPLNSLRDDVPADLAIIISKMIAKDPGKRFQTPVEVADALSKFKVAVAGDVVSANTEVEKARPAFVALTLRRFFSLLAVAISSVLAIGLLSVKGCGDSAQETQHAYTDLSSYLQTGKKTKHNTYSVNALNVLTDSSEGRKLLAKIDADSEELSFANFEDAGAKHAIDWAAALIHDDRVTPRQRELTVTVQHESGSYGPVWSAPNQFHLESVRIAKGGGFSGPKLVIGFTASDRANDRQVVRETFQLKPGKRYEVDVDLVDVIDGSIDWIDLWRNGKEKAGDDQPATVAASPSKPELKVTGKTVDKGTAGLPSLYDWKIKGRDVGDLKVRMLLAQNGKTEVMQEFDFEELPAELANKVRLEVRDAGTGADRKRKVNAILFVESPVPSRSTTLNEDKGLSISVEAPFSNTTELADLEPIEPGQTELLLALSYWKGDMTHDLTMESMTEATNDGNATFLFVTVDWSPANPDVTQLQGDWETLSVTESGKQLATENGFGGLLLQIKGNRFVIKERTPNGDISDVDNGRIEIGSTTTPKTIDFIDRDQPNQRSLGIYELDDGVLRICLAEQGGTDASAGERIPDTKPLKRPTTFDSPAGSNIMLMEFRRTPDNTLKTVTRRADVLGMGKVVSFFPQESDQLATIDLNKSERAVELWVSGDDAKLVQEGNRVRLEFEGWPAAEPADFFGGKVISLYPTADVAGMFRVLIKGDDSVSWPDKRYLRPGVRANCWIFTAAQNPAQQSEARSSKPTVEEDASAPAGDVPAKENDIPNIQGTWQVTYSEDGGRIAPQEMLKQIRFVIDKQNLTTEFGGRKSVSTYKLDPSTNPKSIDLTENGRTKRAIYDLVGDTLRICIAESGDQRPTAFDSQPNSANDIVLILKRVKPDNASADGTEDQNHNGPLSEELACSLIPEAASISNEDFQKLQTNPAAQTIKNKSLSLVLMALDIRDQSPEAANEFRFLVEGYPKPSEIAAAMSPSRSKGYFSIIQPDYITECKITNSTDEIARGKVTFNAPKLYIGSATFKARKHDGTWQIEKFHLPSRQISIELGEDENWHHEGREAEGNHAPVVDLKQDNK
ncbi:protein containing Serine/threonine protein kinase [Rhodopirellula europaea 6C]|uniref:Protein containing Serine/threonine protein kinase n=1 Tax=Rhodopirellula europaea 6C TaxID=1263867 RepID=M2B7X4_9BACT|nr:protein containing Serine/threonine protein kinase [Rhodopirellula europaea 6C]